MAKSEGTCSIHHVAFGMDAAIKADLAELTAGDEVARQYHHWIAEIVESDLSLDSGDFSRIRHFASVAGPRRERLFEVDMLAGGDRCERDLLVKRVGRGEVDDVDLGIRNEAFPVATGVGKAEAACRDGSKFVGPVRDRMQDDVIGQVEDTGRGREAEHVGPAHEAGSDQAKLELRL